MTVDWGRLEHAYGPAIDTPEHLRALRSSDAEARAAALEHLDVAVLHQGFPQTATAPAVRAVTALLADGRAHPDMAEPLLEFLGHAALTVTDLADDRRFTEVLADLGDAVTQAYPVALSLLAQAPPDRALFRAEILVAIAQIPHLAPRREDVAVLVRELADRDTGPQAPWVALLGRLGVDVRDRLADPDRAVRLRAALVHEDHPRSQELIMAALADRPPSGVHQCELVAAAIRIAGDFDTICAAACQVASRDSWTGFDDGWGALVRFAFPEPHRDSEPMSGAQRALLRALATNDEIWDPKNGSCALVFTRAGLPHSRDACRRLAG